MKAVLAAVFVTLCLAPAGAAEVAPPIPDAVTRHVQHLAGQTIPYTARAGMLDLHDASGAVNARMFYAAYSRDGANAATRPVTFFYNGGPGSSTMSLHLASFGPVRVPIANARAQATLVENEFSLLDTTDLVFIDAPQTGYSRYYGDPHAFLGVDRDGRAFAQFVRAYLARFGRTNSPVFLFGESYGTTRSCVVADLLARAGVRLSGVVLLSSVITQSGYETAPGSGDWGYVFYLPSQAATARAYGKATRLPASDDAFLAQAEAFAQGEYAHALSAGDTLPQARRDDVAAKLQAYLGIPKAYFLAHDLRITTAQFRRRLLRERKLITGRYDSRAADPNSGDSAQPDPGISHVNDALIAEIGVYMKDDLKYDPGITYGKIPDRVALFHAWDNRHDGVAPPYNVATDLADAMRREPHMLVLSANGRYDFATPFFHTQYVLNHLDVPQALRRNVTFALYPAGHMVYMDARSRPLFRNDLVRWYAVALKENR